MGDVIREAIVTYVVPAAVGFFECVVIPWSIKRYTQKKLSTKIEEVSPSSEYRKINKRLELIERNILEMRGKTK